jgi:hypothetical protein
MPIRLKVALPIVLVILLGVIYIWRGPYFFGPSSQCSLRNSSGKLNITKMDMDVPPLWCWATTTSEILQWYRLPDSKACEIFDLVKGKTSCADKQDPIHICADPPSPGTTCWKFINGNNQSDFAKHAADRYEGKYHTITSVERNSEPLSYPEIQQMICPSDGTLGKPFIYVFYDTYNDINHDVVIMGYKSISIAVGSPTINPSDKVTKALRYLYVHDQMHPDDPQIIDYDDYSDEKWERDVVISKLPQLWWRTIF